VRAFIAIDLEPEIKETLQSLVRGLKTARADIRWASAEGMHLTLKFLGPIDESQSHRVEDILAGIAKHHAPFPLRLERTGAFPGETSPRVLWVGFAADPELLAVQEEIEQALEAEGFEREKRGFTPHLTLGRVKGPDRVAKAMAELEKHNGESFGAMTVRKIALFESVLRPDGAEYRIVFEAGLG
jgi:RNA 2',3'-cyclic 3'-phosphodiesterase